MIARRRPIRRGLSLIEVLLALAIFLFSLVAVSRLIDIGADMALEIDQRGRAAQLAQSKLAEVMAGAVPLNSQGDTPCEGDDADWNWRMDAESETTPGLYKVTVTVGKDTRRGRVEIAFSQYVLDPTKRGSTDATAIGTDDSTTGTTSSTTTGGTP
ncbi:MAG: type II secretion system protein [Gemmataceae bacterium]|nr:type II secretion system protein [Gemmataceae bacterium]